MQATLCKVDLSICRSQAPAVDMARLPAIHNVGTQGNWAPRNAFSVKECGVVVEPLTLPSLAVIRIFEYL